MLSSQEDQQERLATLENDKLVREADARRLALEGTTFHRHAQSAADETNQGRFASLGVPHVVGATAGPTFPPLPASSPWSGAQPGPGIEPVLGYDVNALETSAAPPVAEAGVPTAAAPSSSVQAHDNLASETSVGASPSTSQE
jgi:hypothetical protein